MDIKQFIDNIILDLKNSNESKFDYDLGNYPCKVVINNPTDDDKFNFPYILVIPKDIKDKCTLAVETNNLESDIQEYVLKNGLEIAKKLTINLKSFSSPVLIPLLPSVKDGPYYQQLSRECFDTDETNKFYRIDLQLINLIEKVKKDINATYGITVNDKIFLNGYSSSGVFAQRFNLLHPNIVDTLCVGGASGSIPIPITDLDYPLGIGDYEKITGQDFDIDSYSSIKQRYYVGSLESLRKVETRFDEDGNYAPMHDMSYFENSVPKNIGEKQRNIFGRDLIDRSSKQIYLMEQMGIDIEQTIFPLRTHNNINGTGVNELGDSFIENTYSEMLHHNKGMKV